MKGNTGFGTLATKTSAWVREIQNLKAEIEKKRTVIVHPESQFAKDPEKAKKLSEDWQAREREQIQLKLKKLTGGKK